LESNLGSFGSFHVLGRPVIGRMVAGFGKNPPGMNGMDADEEVPIRDIRARIGKSAEGEGNDRIMGDTILR
jgi:hypothetical protein